MSERDAQALLKDTDSGAKNELLFSKYGINYNNLPAMFRKGTTMYWGTEQREETGRNGQPTVRNRRVVVITHEDIIQDDFFLRTGALPVVHEGTVAPAAPVELLR
jgi:tRNA(His) guanylyltransferase